MISDDRDESIKEKIADILQERPEVERLDAALTLIADLKTMIGFLESYVERSVQPSTVN
jgi:hypothetical protein